MKPCFTPLICFNLYYMVIVLYPKLFIELAQKVPAAVDVIHLVVLIKSNSLHAVCEGSVQHSDA